MMMPAVSEKRETVRVTRAEALRIARQILEQAEAERAEIWRKELRQTEDATRVT